MKRVFRLSALFLLGAALGAPSGIYLIHHEFIQKEKAEGMLAEENIADGFAKDEFAHADPQTTREALTYAVQIHKEMQVSNSKYWGVPQKVKLAWCYNELSVLEKSAGNTELAGKYMADADQIYRELNVKDSTVARLKQAIEETQAKPISNHRAIEKPQ